MYPGSDPSRPSFIADVRWWIRGFSVLRNSLALAHYKGLAGALPQHNGQKLCHSAVQKSLFFHHLTFAIDHRRLVIRLGCVDGWAASVFLSESVRSASLRQIHSLVLRSVFVRFRCSCCGVLVSTAAQLARRSRYGDPAFVIWAQALLILCRLICFFECLGSVSVQVKDLSRFVCFLHFFFLPPLLRCFGRKIVCRQVTWRTSEWSWRAPMMRCSRWKKPLLLSHRL